MASLSISPARRLLLLGVTCWAALASAASRPPVYADLADRARALPAEFAAEALLRIADAPINDIAWKREILEDAFQLAAGAQQPYARRNWSGKPGSMFDKAYAQGLDTCTLQCKAVHAMLAIDYKKARELFGGIPAPHVPRTSCTDALVYDVSIFYRTAGEVAARAFNAKEIADEEPFHLFQRYTADINSPVQIAPVARMLAAASLRPAQFEVLVDTLAGSLQQLPADARSFSATLADGTGDAIAALHTQAPVDAWHDYAARQLHLKEETPCPDPPPVGQCSSPECAQLAKQFTSLVIAPSGYGLTAEQKSAAEWSGKLRQYLAALADWKESDDPVEYFQFKSRFYSQLFELAPPGPDRDMVLGMLLAWLQQSRYQRDHRAEWFYPLNALIVQAFTNRAEMQSTIRDLRRSTDPVITLYAQLEQLFPRPMENTLGLL